MSETGEKTIKVFIASPGDLIQERKEFRETIKRLNVGFGDGANIKFIPLGWEDKLANTGIRNQSVINEDVDDCDVFILVLYRRWGQEACDAGPYSSYTEEEFHRALDRLKKSGTPEIFIFFKRVSAESLNDPGPQLQKVIDFKKHLEETKHVLYRYFDSLTSFTNEVDKHLRAYAKGELPKEEKNRSTVVLPLEVLKEVKAAKKIARLKAEEAKKANDTASEMRFKLETIQLQTAEDAARLSNEGKIEFAKEKFAGLAMNTTNIRILSLSYEFFRRTGDLDSAFSVLNKWLNISGPDNNTEETAGAHNNLGNLYMTKGELDKAEELFCKSFDINNALNCKKGIAISSASLGNLFGNKGEYEKAEKMYRKALEIEEDLCLDEEMEKTCCDLGNLYTTKREYDKAEEMFQKSLKIGEVLGESKQTAITYGFLGVFHKIRGEYEKAEKMYRKALEIDEFFGHEEGKANQYGNLGGLFIDSGKLDKGEEMLRKSLKIDIALGRKVGIATAYSNLGILYANRREFDKAEKMLKKSFFLFQDVQSPHAKEVEKIMHKLRS